MDLPQVSVIIPCYNRASLIGQTIENMLRQTLPPQEVIVVDDGSTDDSVAVVKSFGGSVRLVQQPNRGPSTARNAGLAVATGRFIQFMDSDDFASLNKLEVQVEAMDARGAEMAYGPWIHLTLDGRHVRHLNHVLQRRAVPSRLPPLEWHLRGWALVLQTCLFTRAFLGKVGPLKPDLIGTEDTEFLNRVFIAGPKTVFTPNCIVFYRLHDSGKLSGSGTTTPKKLDQWSRALIYISTNLQEIQRPVSIVTRFFFAYRAWRLWREMAALNTFQSEQLQQIRELCDDFPALAYHIFSAAHRIFSALRVRLTGSSWTRPYRAGRAGPDEMLWLRQAGLVLDTGVALDTSAGPA